jgi:hypothetical protein
MLSTVLRYEIEIVDRTDEKIGWKVRNTIRPNYDVQNRFKRRRFLLWKWDRAYAVIFNEKEARTKARRKAFRIAKRLYPEYTTRVIVVFQFPEVDEPIRHCVWENGRYYSFH